MTSESFLDSVKHFVGVEDARTKKKHEAEAHLGKATDAGWEAFYNMYLAGKDGAAVLGDKLSEEGGHAREYSAEQLSQLADFISRKAGVLAQASKEKLADAAETSREELGKFGEYSKDKLADFGEYSKEKFFEAAEISREKLGEFGEYSKEKGAEGLQYSSEKAAEAAKLAREELAKGYEYTSQKAAEAAVAAKEELSKGYDYTAQKASEGYDYTAQKASEGYEFTAEKAAEGVDSARDGLAEAQRKVVETISELPDNAGHSVVRFRDEAGRVWERIKSGTGDYYERFVEEPALDSKEQAKGVFGKLGSGLSNLGSNLNSIFHSADKSGRKLAEDAAQNAESKYEYVKNSVGDYVLKAKAGAEEAADRAQSSWDDLYNSKEWQQFFKQNSKIDEAWWKQYFQTSNFSPSSSHWQDYITSFMGGPSKLDKFWKKAEKKGFAARDSVRGKFHEIAPRQSVKDSWFGSSDNTIATNQPWIGIGSNGNTSSVQNGAFAAPVALFWSAILVMYILAKRITEQRQLILQHARANGPSPTPASVADSKDVSYSEKARLAAATPANHDSLTTFAIYAPATTFVLLAQEVSGSMRSSLLHGLYATLFLGQFLQGETQYVRDAKARGLGVYLSWAAAGVAGLSGLFVSMKMAL